MDTNIPLTERQLEIIWYAARNISSARVPDFIRYVESALRPKRLIADTDVTHAVCAGLVKIAPQNNLYKRTGS